MDDFFKFFLGFSLGALLMLVVFAINSDDKTILVCYHPVDGVQKTTILDDARLSLPMSGESYCYLEQPGDTLYKVHREMLQTYAPDGGVYTFNRM